MAIEVKEQQETLHKDLIEKVEKDPLPTNIFDISETDPFVLLGKLNEIVAKLKAINALIASSDNKADEAVKQAISALSKAGEAFAKALHAEAIAKNNETIAENAEDKANLAIVKANEANTKAEEANEQAQTANDTAGDALAEADTALQTARQALEQVTESLGTKVYDNHGNLMNTAKFTGHNGINVDMSESDPETFDIRLDNSITSAIEDNHTQGQTNKANIEALTTRVTANEGDMVELTNMLSATEELAQNATEEITNTINPKLASLEAKDNEQDNTINLKINKTLPTISGKITPDIVDGMYWSYDGNFIDTSNIYYGHESGVFLKKGNHGLFVGNREIMKFDFTPQTSTTKICSYGFWKYGKLLERTNGTTGTYTLSKPLSNYRAILVIANFANGGLTPHIMPTELATDIMRIGHANNRMLITSDSCWADFCFSSTQVQLKGQKALTGFIVYGINN